MSAARFVRVPADYYDREWPVCRGVCTFQGAAQRSATARACSLALDRIRPRRYLVHESGWGLHPAVREVHGMRGFRSPARCLGFELNAGHTRVHMPYCLARTCTISPVPDTGCLTEPLEFRRDCLGAASIDHLCKSIVMENTR